MNGDLTPLLVAAVIGVPLLIVGVLALGRFESWRERRRDARGARAARGARRSVRR
jgi:hypothetical protein